MKMRSTPSRQLQLQASGKGCFCVLQWPGMVGQWWDAGAQVGVCSGLVLGFLAAVVAVHFVSSRRSGGVPFSPKASGSYGTGLSSAYSPPSGFQQGPPGCC